MNIQKLKKILKAPEGPKLDFKERLKLETESDKKELVKDITAIANSKGGRGYIIFGVKDKTKDLIGIEVEEEVTEERIQQIICNRVDPPVPVRFSILDYKSVKIGIITIFKSEQQPHQIRQTGNFYIRRGSTTDIARRQEISNMLQEAGMISAEMIILKNGKVEDLDHELIKTYLERINIPIQDINKILLEGLGFVKKNPEKEQYYPTVGGMLLFGKNPQIYLPHSCIKIEYYNEAYYFSGNIVEMLDKTEQFLEEKLLKTNYPIKALYEVIENAVVHRDYWDLSREIVVVIQDHLIEVINPGSLWTTKNIYKLLNEYEPPRRNPWLYQRLLTFDKKNRFLKTGYGIHRIEKAFDVNFKIRFININSKNLFKVQLPGIKYYK